jgi:hypothetical protein
VEAYERSVGHEANTLRDTGVPVIVVTMRGNKTGKVRLKLFGCDPRLMAAIGLRLTDPLAQRLVIHTQLLADRHDRRPLRPVLGGGLQHHPHRPVAELRRILARSCHDSILHKERSTPRDPARFRVVSSTGNDARQVH